MLKRRKEKGKNLKTLMIRQDVHIIYITVLILRKSLLRIWMACEREGKNRQLSLSKKNFYHFIWFELFRVIKKVILNFYDRTRFFQEYSLFLDSFFSNSGSPKQIETTINIFEIKIRNWFKRFEKLCVYEFLIKTKLINSIDLFCTFTILFIF